jgi:hypothetical protein
MSQRLHMVFGGELKDPATKEFRNVDEIEVVGIYPNYELAYDAWKGAAQRSVDNAHTRFFIAHLHRLRDEESPTSAVADDS